MPWRRVRGVKIYLHVLLFSAPDGFIFTPSILLFPRKEPVIRWEAGWAQKTHVDVIREEKNPFSLLGFEPPIAQSVAIPDYAIPIIVEM